MEENQESMGGAAKRILAGIHRAVPHKELKAELRKIPRFREMLDKHNGAYYYTMIMRLVDDHDSNVPPGARIMSQEKTHRLVKNPQISARYLADYMARSPSGGRILLRPRTRSFKYIRHIQTGPLPDLRLAMRARVFGVWL